MTQVQCWIAISEGKKLINQTGNIVWLGKVGYARTNGNGTAWNFPYPKNWKIYDEQTIYHKWKKIDQTEVIMTDWTTEDLSKKGWTIVRPGKTFKEITV